MAFMVCFLRRLSNASGKCHCVERRGNLGGSEHEPRDCRYVAPQDIPMFHM